MINRLAGLHNTTARRARHEQNFDDFRDRTVAHQRSRPQETEQEAHTLLND